MDLWLTTLGFAARRVPDLRGKGRVPWNAQGPGLIWCRFTYYSLYRYAASSTLCFVLPNDMIRHATSRLYIIPEFCVKCGSACITLLVTRMSYTAQFFSSWPSSSMEPLEGKSSAYIRRANRKEGIDRSARDCENVSDAGGEARCSRPHASTTCRQFRRLCLNILRPCEVSRDLT